MIHGATTKQRGLNMATAKAATVSIDKGKGSKTNNSKTTAKAGKNMKAEETKAEETKAEETVLIPQEYIDTINNYQKQIEVNTVDMQKLAFEIGKGFNTIKALYNKATKQFGPKMTVLFPKIDSDYRGSYMYMAEHEKAIKVWLKATGKGSKLSSCRSIQRQYAASLKEKAEEKTEEKAEEAATEKRSLKELIAEMKKLAAMITKAVDGKQLASDNKADLESIGKTINALTK